MLHSRAETDLKRWCNWFLSSKTGFNGSMEGNERNWITIQGLWSSVKMKSLTWANHFYSSLTEMLTDHPGSWHQITNIVLIIKFRFINLALLDEWQHLWYGFLHVVKATTNIPCLNHREKLDKKWLRFLSLHLHLSLTFKNYGHQFMLIIIF